MSETPANESFTFGDRQAIPLLLILAVLAMLPGLWMGMHADDWFQVRHRPWGEVLATFLGDWNEGRRGMGGFYRPIVRASFALDGRLYGLAPWGYHLTNGILFVLSALGVYRLCREAAGAAPAAALLLSSVFFIFHPQKNEALFWLSGRTDLLGGLFCIWALVYTFRAIRGNAFPLALAALGFLALGLLSKEVAYGMCLGIPAVALLMGAPGDRRVRTWLVVGPVVLGACFFQLRLFVLGGVAGYASGAPTPIGQLIANYLLMVSALALPWQAEGPALFSPWGGVLGILIAAMLVLIGRFTRPVLALMAAMAFAFLPMAPITISPPDGERVLFLPLALLVAFLAAVWAGARITGRTARVAGFATLLLGFTLQADNFAIKRVYWMAREHNHRLMDAAWLYADTTPDGAAVVVPDAIILHSRRILNPGDSMMMAILSHWMQQPGATWRNAWEETPPRAGFVLSTPGRTIFLAPATQPWMERVERLRYTPDMNLEALSLRRIEGPREMLLPQIENEALHLTITSAVRSYDVQTTHKAPPILVATQPADGSTTATREALYGSFSIPVEGGWRTMLDDAPVHGHPVLRLRLVTPGGEAFQLRSAEEAAYEVQRRHLGIGSVAP